ncbi:MAG: DUF1294 domain-containing protein [Deltaproteobacteria bacterium]
MHQSINQLTVIKNIAIYLLIINVFGFLSMMHDKKMAQTGNWRVKEKTLLLIALAGGSIGSLLGMYKFRHKTKHFSFKYGIPLIIMLQIFCFIVYKFNLYTPIIEFLKHSI